MSIPPNAEPGWYVEQIAELVLLRSQPGRSGEDRDEIQTDINLLKQAFHRRLVNLAEAAGNGVAS